MLIVPALVLGMLWVGFAGRRQRLGFGALSVRGALLLAYLAFEVILLLMTELTSVGHHFTRWTLIVCWIVVLAGCIPFAFGSTRWRTNGLGSVRAFRTTALQRIRRLSIEDRIWIAVVICIFGVLIAIGLTYQPSYADSMFYHLARVEHWVQDRSIAIFATPYLPQVDLAPLSEYNLANLHLLAGTDYYDASMQLLAAAVSMVAASELARLLGGSRSTQIAASVICATIPSGVLLAVTTENDYFAAANGMVLLVLLASMSFGGRWVYRAAAIGLAAGTTYLAKQTTPIILGPAVATLFVGVLYREVIRPKRKVDELLVVRYLAVLVAGVVAVVGPFVYQLQQVFGSVTGPTSSGLVDSQLSVNGSSANVLRSIAANYDIGNGTNGLNTAVSRVVLGGLRHLYGLTGVMPSDPRFTVGLNPNPFDVSNYTVIDRIGDIGANPWHLALAALATVILIVAVLRGARLRMVCGLAVSLAAGYLLFSALAKWSDFNVRYTLPLLVAFSPVIAIALSRWSRWVLRIVLIGLVAACLPQLIDDAPAPLISPSVSGPYLTGYFVGAGALTNATAEASAYGSVAKLLARSGCQHAALANWVQFEYPLWVGLAHEGWRGTIDDVNVTNPTRQFEARSAHCAWLRQVGPDYVTPTDGTINLQYADLALSLSPSTAPRLRTSFPGFTSRVPGVAVYPGGGWSLAAGSGPAAHGRATLYVSSTTARQVRLEFSVPNGKALDPLTVTEGGGVVVGPSGAALGSVTVDLRPGVNPITISTGNGSPVLRFTSISAG